jgi:hypothetical protein
MSAKTSSDSNIMSTATASVTKTTKATKTPKATASAEPVVAAPVVAAPAPAAAKVSKKAEKVAAAPVAAPAAPVATTETVAAPVAAVDEDIGVSLANAVSRQQELVAAAKTNAAEQAANLKTIEKLSARLAYELSVRTCSQTLRCHGNLAIRRRSWSVRTCCMKPRLHAQWADAWHAL